MTEWMIVYTTNDITEAHIIAGRLEVEGVKVMVNRQVGAAAYGFTVGKIGEVNIVVHPNDYERALAILEPDELYALSEDNEQIVYYDYHEDGEDDDAQ
jgi:hypothetical protein